MDPDLKTLPGDYLLRPPGQNGKTAHELAGTSHNFGGSATMDSYYSEDYDQSPPIIEGGLVIKRLITRTSFPPGSVASRQNVV